MKNGCVISFREEETAAMVRAVLLLSGIACDGGVILVTDSLPNDTYPYKGIVLLSRTRRQEQNNIPVTVLRPPLCFDELSEAVWQMFENTADPTAKPADACNHAVTSVQVHDGCVSYRGKSAQLTVQESRLFEFLRCHAGTLVTRRELLCEVWDGADGETNIVDVYVSYLRRKLIPIFGQGVLLTVRGKGYILCLPDENEM